MWLAGCGWPAPFQPPSSRTRPTEPCLASGLAPRPARPTAATTTLATIQQASKHACTHHPLVHTHGPKQHAPIRLFHGCCGCWCEERLMRRNRFDRSIGRSVKSCCPISGSADAHAPSANETHRQAGGRQCAPRVHRRLLGVNNRSIRAGVRHWRICWVAVSIVKKRRKPAASSERPGAGEMSRGL